VQKIPIKWDGGSSAPSEAVDEKDCGEYMGADIVEVIE
jgi:hypothetical protein